MKVTSDGRIACYAAEGAGFGAVFRNHCNVAICRKKVVRPHDLVQLRVYWVGDGFQTPRNRGDLIRDECLWLFKEPNDLSNFRPCELEFTGWIDQDSKNGMTKFDARRGAIHGECRETPSSADRVDPQPATVVEYYASSGAEEDSELLVLEVGGLNENGEQNDEGGIVHFFLGSPIASCDIEFV